MNDENLSDSAWDESSNLRSLRKSNPTLAHQRALVALESWPTDSSVQQSASWIIYDNVFSVLDDNSSDDEFRNAFTKFKLMVSWTPNGEYSPYDATVQCGVKLASVLNECRKPVRALQVLELLRPNDVSDKPSKQYPSLRSRWYMQYTKSLELLERWTELVESCKAALRNSELGPQKRWIHNRLSQAFEGTGQPEKALDELDNGFPNSREPWVLIKKGGLLASCGRDEEAIEVLRSALTATPKRDLGMSWRGIRDLAQLLESKEQAQAILHYRVAIRVRSDAQWPEDQSLIDSLLRLSSDSTPATDEEIDTARKWWAESGFDGRSEGIVSKHLAHGGAGFIALDDGQSIYFSRRPNDERPLPEVGPRVSFRIVSGFDHKKNKESLRATDVKQIS
jgi:tetratricopeptide (TPR) repeat protein